MLNGWFLLTALSVIPANLAIIVLAVRMGEKICP